MANDGSSANTSNKFANDGSFMEMFRKQMEKQKDTSSKDTKVPSTSNDTKDTDNKKSSVATSEPCDVGKKPVPLVGKRRGATRALKTGIVLKKPKPATDETDPSSKTGDAWSKYLKEVKEYKSKMCIEEDKSRPLVK